MIAFGGAAPLHAARLADKLGVARVVIPGRERGLSARLPYRTGRFSSSAQLVPVWRSSISGMRTGCSTR